MRHFLCRNVWHGKICKPETELKPPLATRIWRDGHKSNQFSKIWKKKIYWSTFICRIIREKIIYISKLQDLLAVQPQNYKSGLRLRRYSIALPQSARSYTGKRVPLSCLHGRGDTKQRPSHQISHKDISFFRGFLHRLCSSAVSITERAEDKYHRGQCISWPWHNP
jgi:hypothetical protein